MHRLEDTSNCAFCGLLEKCHGQPNIFYFACLWLGTNHWAIIHKRHEIANLWCPSQLWHHNSNHPEFEQLWLLPHGVRQPAPIKSQHPSLWSAAIPLAGPSLLLRRCLPVQDFINNPVSFHAPVSFPLALLEVEACLISLTYIFWFNMEVLFQTC